MMRGLLHVGHVGLALFAGVCALGCVGSHDVLLAPDGGFLEAILGDGGVVAGAVPSDAAPSTTPTGEAPTGESPTGQAPAAGCVDCQGADLLGAVQLPSCCTAETRCGLDLEMLAGMALCLERDAPGTPDAACPSAMVMGVALPGCCRPDGTCGVQSLLVPLGCVSGSLLAGLLGGGGDGGDGGGASMRCGN